jgi:transcriptional regulator with XRE-family HTH domain
MTNHIVPTSCTVWENIRHLRLSYGWNQQHFAHLLGISVSAVSKIETGITEVRLSRLKQIANIFEIDIVQLLTMEHGQIKTAEMDSLSILKNKIFQHDAEIIKLRSKLIELYQEHQDRNLIIYANQGSK